LTLGGRQKEARWPNLRVPYEKAWAKPDVVGACWTPSTCLRAVTAWLAARPPRWRRRVKIAALDPYAGYKTALTSKLHGLPEARLVVDHWHAIRLANQMVDEVRRRVARGR
jgi:hypothetical protein